MKTLSLLIALCLMPLSVGADKITICTDLVYCKYGKDENCNCIKPPKAESKSQEYMEKCDEWLDSIYSISHILGINRVEELPINAYKAQIATAYCTRALLEEMRK